MANMMTSAAPYLASIRTPPSIKARRILKGHFGKITALHWAGDSKKVISASQDGNLLLWNAVTTNKLRAITLKSSYVMAVGIEQTKGKLVACGGLDNLCTIYKMDGTGTALNPIEMASHDGFLSCCRFLSEDQILTSSGDSTCLRWNITTGGKVMDSFAEHKADALFLALRPNDPNVFLSCSVDKTIKLWDLRSPQSSKQTFTGHEGDVNGVDFLPSDNNAFATCSDDGTVRLWDVRAYQEVSRFGTLKQNDNSLADTTTSGYTSVSCSKSGRLIFCGHSDGHVMAFDVLNDRTTPAFTITQAHDGNVSCLGVSPDGNALCTGSWDFVLKLWA